MTDLAGPQDEQPMEEVAMSVENVGGIEKSSISIAPGINVLAGRNATNRTSLLTAIRGVLGGSEASLKSDAEEGHVSMEIGEETYATHYRRTPNSVRTGGTSFSNDGEFVDLFVSLLEDNPTRRAVQRGDDLREIIMRPVDTEAIESRIDALRTQIVEIDDEMDLVESRRSELPALEDRRRSLKEKIAALNDDISNLREKVSDAEQEMETKDDSNDIVEALEQCRGERNSIANELEVKRAERDALYEETEETEDELDSLEDMSTEDIEAVQRDLEGARERKKELDEIVTSLSTIVEVNDDLLHDDQTLPGIEADDSDVTSQLVQNASRQVNCWTCGSRVEGGVIKDRLEDLNELISEKRNDRRELSDRIDDLRKQISESQDVISKRETLSVRLDHTRGKIDSLKSEIESLEAEIEESERDIADLETQLAEVEDDRADDLSQKYEEISDLKFERGRLERELEDVEAEIEEIEALPAEEALADQRKELRSELKEMRERISSLESSAVEAFNIHMDELLHILDYENIARVWIERKRVDSKQSSEFDLHVVRASLESASYEDVLANLSESEREVIGLVVALAGYLVHEVHEMVPFILLDSVEAIDGERISLLVDYFSDFVDYLVVALLPDDAAALEDLHQDITMNTFS